MMESTRGWISRHPLFSLEDTGGQVMPRTADIKEELAKKANRQKKDADIHGQDPPEGTGLQTGKTIRLLRADEIECRVSTINIYGLRLLLYKDARVDQKILDEMFTPFGWQRTHQEIDGKLYCTVSVWDDTRGQWISKQDVGTASYSDKEKGQASDSFKRACFNWGIGRELYTAPDIWVPASYAHIRENKDKRGHYTTSDRFSVHSISYNLQREISSLIIINQDGNVVFRMLQAGQQQEQPTTDASSIANTGGTPGTGIQMELLKHELERTGIPMETVLRRYNIQDPSQMTPEICTRALNGLRKTKSNGAA